MKRSHYRTQNRSLVLRIVKVQSLTVKLIHLQLKEMFEAGKLNRIPAVNQLYRTLSDLRKDHFVVGTKSGRATYYKRV